MIYLRKISSLNNFKSSALSGQIATILILIMVAMIIFILVTLNIGNVSFKATKVANTADSAALYLASIIATQAHYIYHALGDSYHYCVKGGWLGAILAFITAVILTICGHPESWYWFALELIAACAAAGAIGNYIATGTLKGAVQGAIQGAAIGAAFAIGGGYVPSENVLVVLGTNLVTFQAIAAIALGTITTAAAIYNQSVKEKRVGENMATLSKQLNGLPEYEGTREGVFLYALGQAVDDPTMTDPDKSVDCGKDPVVAVQGGDPLDLDNDGETNEKSSCFDYWWYNHIEDLKSTITSYKDLITHFFEDYLTPFYEHTLDFLPEMDRSEIECDCGSGAESPMTALFRALDKCTYDLKDGSNFIWKPGPTKSGLLSYYDCPTNCNTPAGWDEYDATHMHYEDFIDYAKGILNPDECGFYKYDANKLSKALRNRYNGSASGSDWFDELFDNRTTGDFYDIFTGIAGWMVNWRNRIISIRDKLPGCQLVYKVDPDVTSIDKIKDAAQPYCAEKYPPVYPCNWELEKKDFTGAYFPNPVCKLYPTDKTTLSSEIVTVENFVVSKSNLENWIRNKYYSSPCGPNCWLVPNPGAPPGAPLVEINVNSIRLVGNIHSKCSKTGLNPAGAKLYINYNYRYTCRCCIAPSCGTTCSVDPATGAVTCGCSCSCNGLPCAGNFCSSFCLAPCTVCTDCQCSKTTNCCTTVDHSYAGINQIKWTPIAAGDLNIPWLDVDAFLGALENFQNTVDSVSDTFATIDEDTVDEFQPVLDMLSKESDAIDTFLPGVQQMDNDLSSRADNRATNGAGSVVYKWDDTEGEHPVKVESGAFQFPYTSKSKHGNFLVNKKCIDLNIPAREQAWIQITRTDPGQKILNSSATDLGLKWNPFQGPMVIKRKSTASYSATSVGIGSIK